MLLYSFAFTWAQFRLWLRTGDTLEKQILPTSQHKGCFFPFLPHTELCVALHCLVFQEDLADVLGLS